MTEVQKRFHPAHRITIVGSIVNLVLCAAKITAGILGHSKAMLADGFHSLSDLSTDIVVITGLFIASKPKDKTHDYGHGKFETLSTAIIGVSLFIVGLGILRSGISNIIGTFKGDILPQPGLIAFIMALISIAAKEILFQFTLSKGKQIHSQAVIANAWHHRSDALSSIGAALGIGGAIFLGDRFRVLDPAAAVIVGLLILKVAWSISINSLKELTETSLSEDEENEILDIINTIPGVHEPHNLRTRKIGNDLAIDIHIRVDKNSTIQEAHDIASKVENELFKNYGKHTIINVHIEPHSNN